VLRRKRTPGKMAVKLYDTDVSNNYVELIAQNGSGEHTSFLLTENVDLFPGDSGTNLETDYSPPLSVKFESQWRYASTPQDA
jgi:hypothetical protein